MNDLAQEKEWAEAGRAKVREDLRWFLKIMILLVKVKPARLWRRWRAQAEMGKCFDCYVRTANYTNSSGDGLHNILPLVPSVPPRKSFNLSDPCYENWVVPAGVGSALADILGAEFGQIIGFDLEWAGGVYVIIVFMGGLRGADPTGCHWVSIISSFIILIISANLISEDL